MKGLGMRDRNSREITAALTGRSAEEVCDPVILYGFKDELKDMERPVDYRYMLVYAYDKRMNEDDEVSKIRAYAKSKGLRIVSPGFFHKWADCNVSVDPIGLLRYFKFADCIVTDTFHCSVMSIITHREFAVILRDNSNKLFNILEEYALEDRSCRVMWRWRQYLTNGLIMAGLTQKLGAAGMQVWIICAEGSKNSTEGDNEYKR